MFAYYIKCLLINGYASTVYCIFFVSINTLLENPDGVFLIAIELSVGNSILLETLYSDFGARPFSMAVPVFSIPLKIFFFLLSERFEFLKFFSS